MKIKIKKLAEWDVVKIPTKKSLKVKGQLPYYTFSGYNKAKEEYDNTLVDITKLMERVDKKKFTNLIGYAEDEETEMCISDFLKWDMINHIAKAIIKELPNCIKKEED